MDEGPADAAADGLEPAPRLSAGELDAERQAEVRRRQEWRPVRVLWVVLVCIAAIGGFLVTVATDRTDSALLFVGLPAGLALFLALLPAPRTLHGTVFVSITMCLLICAAIIQEGAVCLLLAAPLIYLVGHGVAALVAEIKMGRRRLPAVLVLPLLALSATEGVVPTLRIEPIQVMTLARQVALDPATVTDRVAAGPRFGAAKPLLLRAGYPTPDHAIGAGLDVGQYWHFGQHGGGILTQVIGDQVVSGGRRIEFRLVSDTSMTNHALIWRTATLSWTPAPHERSNVRLTISFERRLDPSWYFGPLEQGYARAGGNYLLDSLGLEPAP